jgi:hypothetical protein
VTTSRRFRLVIGALATGILVNSAILVFLPVGSQPFRPHADDGLLHLVETEQASLHLEHAFYLELHEVAAGRVLVAPEGLLDETFVDGLADMQMRTRPADTSPGASELIDGTDTTHGIVRPSDRSEDEYDYVILDPGPDQRLHVLVDGSTIVVVGESRLDEVAP